MDRWHPTRAAIEALLSGALGVPVVIAGSERLAPGAVERCHLSVGGDGRLPPTVIVKWLRDHPSGFRTDPSQVRTERAALEFLTGLGTGLAPRLLAGDVAAGVLVLEDLHPRVPLSDLVAGDDRLASSGLSAFARTLGELHAATVGYEDAYYERRRTFGPVNPQVERERPLGPGWDETPASVEAMLGVPMSAVLERDVADLRVALSDPGPFLAFSTGDPGANNFMFDGSDGRLIDFEFAGFRNALADASVLHVPGPMWITVADPIASGLEGEYRKSLCQTVAEGEDDPLFGLGIAAGSLAYAILRLKRLPILDARPVGEPSRAQMIATLEQASAAAEAHRSLTHLSGWARRVAETLRRRWPDTDIDFDTTRYAPRWR